MIRYMYKHACKLTWPLNMPAVNREADRSAVVTNSNKPFCSNGLKVTVISRDVLSSVNTGKDVPNGI